MNIKSFVAIAATCLLAGCGGGSSGSAGTPPAATPASPGGIWTGTDSVTGMQVTALISESGQLEAIRADKVQFLGTLSVTGNSISADIEGDAAFGSAFPDGSIHGTGKVTGTLTARTSIQATVTFTTDKGETSTSNIPLAFQSSYLTPQNIPGLAGTYMDSATGVAVSINSSGAIFAQDPVSGCVINGQVNVVIGGYSLYALAIDYANCTGSLAPFNGLQFAGFATFSGSTALVGLQDKSGRHYGLVFQLTKS